MKTKEVSFKISKKDHASVSIAVKRAERLFKKLDSLSTSMDLIACHANGCRLNFDKLLSFPDFDFMHDIGGIGRHLNRETGELMNCFLPRCHE